MTAKNLILCAICACILFPFACKKDDAPAAPTVPQLTTATITNITDISASGGGTITGNGGETITASGICWSSTNQTPTVSDDSTKTNAASGSFTAMITNLVPSTTYYVRAYAINSKGTGYGNVVTFSTGNGAPTATTLAINGNHIVGATLTAEYTYSDPESDPESGSVFKWYIANDASGTGETVISGATGSTYIIKNAEDGKYIRFGITPKSSAGNTNSTEVKSEFLGAIGDVVTFQYNGSQVVYGIITSTTTGKKWLDRNLGAIRRPQSVNDYKAYGDLFQWGRLADGHQHITRTDGTDEGATGVTGTTDQQSSTDVPSNNKFFTVPDSERKYDWRNPGNVSLWQGVNGTNNPCPAGWRMATENEWKAEGITTINDGYTKLRLTYTGIREVRDLGAISLSNSHGGYWTSTIGSGTYTSGNMSITATEAPYSSSYRGVGLACRCIKN